MVGMQVVQMSAVYDLGPLACRMLLELGESVQRYQVLGAAGQLTILAELSWLARWLCRCPQSAIWVP